MTGTIERTKRSDYRRFQAISTRWMDNDVYGHVNNVVYYSWFDTAVNRLLVVNGLLDIHHGKTIGLVAETGCRYFVHVYVDRETKRPVAVDDKMRGFLESLKT